MDPVQIVMAAIFAMREIQRIRATGVAVTEEQERLIAAQHVKRQQEIIDTITDEIEEHGG